MESSSTIQPQQDCSERRWVAVHRRTTIFPVRPSEPQQHIKLSAFDVQFLGYKYVQRGLVYAMPIDDFESAVDILRRSLSEILVRFYPLAGRLGISEEGVVYIDCNDGGVDFIEASARADVGVDDVVAADVPPVVQQLFAMDDAISLDAHTLPFVAVQATKLRDGLALGLSYNHAIVDGHSMWGFVNAWAQVARGSHPALVPIHGRSLGRNSVINMKEVFARYQSIERSSDHLEAPPFRVKVFHFSEETMSRLKDRANADAKPEHPGISSFLALCGHVWQAVTRARRLAPDDATTFIVAMDCRPRLVPPLPPSYFGNAIQALQTTTAAGQLLDNDVRYAAGLLQKLVRGHGDGNIRKELHRFEKAPFLFKVRKWGGNNLAVGSSPRFSVYENDFGWGKPVAARSGYAIQYDGRMSVNPGREGGGSVDLEICLLPHTMTALEIQPQFLLP